jgi:flagellar biosynthesis/type III secretory pathway M-ring protein FliF/YscJ
MDAGQITWLIVAIVVFILLLVLVLTFVRRRSEGRKEHLRAQAAQMRSKAAEDELEVREREARSLEAKAKAERAAVDAARLRKEAEEASGAAQESRHRIDEQLRKADELDPDRHREAGREAHDDDDRALVRDQGRDHGRHSNGTPTDDPDVEAGLDARRRGAEDHEPALDESQAARQQRNE